ncbi:hypothetical protein Bca4012_086292 [Brassica carinata]
MYEFNSWTKTSSPYGASLDMAVIVVFKRLTSYSLKDGSMSVLMSESHLHCWEVEYHHVPVTEIIPTVDKSGGMRPLRRVVLREPEVKSIFHCQLTALPFGTPSHQKTRRSSKPPVEVTSALKVSGETSEGSVTGCISKRMNEVRRMAKRKAGREEGGGSGTGESRPGKRKSKRVVEVFRERDVRERET